MTPLEIATKAHKGQTRSDGIDYVTHPIAVAEMLTTPQEKAVALLHDVIEDTKWYLDKSMTTSQCFICKSADEVYPIDYEVYEALEAITKVPHQFYEEYLKKVAKSKLATKIKIADMFHNISDSPSQKQKEKYYKGLTYLLSTL